MFSRRSNRGHDLLSQSGSSRSPRARSGKRLFGPPLRVWPRLRRRRRWRRPRVLFPAKLKSIASRGPPGLLEEGDGSKLSVFLASLMYAAYMLLYCTCRCLWAQHLEFWGFPTHQEGTILHYGVLPMAPAAPVRKKVLPGCAVAAAEPPRVCAAVACPSSGAVHAWTWRSYTIARSDAAATDSFTISTSGCKNLLVGSPRWAAGSTSI